MKLQFIAALTLILVSLLSPVAPSKGADNEAKDLRQPALAGTWYPGDPERLRGLINEFLSKVDAGPLEGELLALIAPHAGYVYSGQVAAFAYKQLKGKSFRRVIIIGPSHYVSFKGVAVDLQSAYGTPLGTVPVDKPFAQELLSASSGIQWIPEAFKREHSLEIQVPFLQTVLKDFTIVPVLMRDPDELVCSSLAERLTKTMRKSQEKTLILASTDLSHFHTSEEAKLLDRKFIDNLRALDPKGMIRSLVSGECEACGAAPTVAAMLSARDLGANQTVVLRYANSGDVTGDTKQVVGYLSAAFVRK